MLTLSSASDFTGITVAIALSKLTPYLCFIHMARLKRFSSALSSLSGIESMDFNFESSTLVLSLISITYPFFTVFPNSIKTGQPGIILSLSFSGIIYVNGLSTFVFAIIISANKFFIVFYFIYNIKKSHTV